MKVSAVSRIFWKIILETEFLLRRERIKKAEWVEKWIKVFVNGLVESLNNKNELDIIDIIDFLKQLFPRRILMWYGCHRYLLREKRNAEEKELKDLYFIIKGDRENEEILIDYGLSNILREFSKTGEILN